MSSSDENGLAPHGPGGDRLFPVGVRIIIAVGVFSATFAAFIPAINNGHVWDDDAYLRSHDRYHGFGPEQLRWMFTTFHVGHYMPLTWMSWAVDYAIWGDDLRGFKLGNIALHGLNALLVMLLADRLLALAMPAATARVRGVAAVFVALLFALHPLRVESVAWATERKDCLSGLFYLATILLYLRAVGRPRGRRGVALVLALGTYALALLAKVMSVSLPLVLIALDFYPLKRFGWRRENRGGDSLRSVLLEKVPFVILAIPAVIVAPFAAEYALALGSLHKYGLIDRVAISFFSLAFYVRKFLFPVDLSALYEMPVSVNAFSPRYLLSAGAVLAATVLLVWRWRRWPGGLVVWWCYGVCLGPVIGLVQVGPQIAADRYTYLSCIGFAILLGGGFLAVLRRGPRVLATVMSIFGLASLGALGAMTARQCGFWKNHRTLWAHAIAVDDNCAICHYNLGTALMDDGESESALPQFEHAFRDDPSFAKAAYNWGVVLGELGQPAAAAEKYRLAVNADPEYPAPYFNLAAMARDRGDLSEAIRDYTRAAELTKNRIYAADRADALNGLGSALLRAGRYADAAQRFEEALRLDPNNADSRNNRGLALMRQGAIEQAIGQFRRAIRIDPSHAEAFGNLANALAAGGRPAEAERAYQEAIRLAPTSPALHTSYGNFLAARKRPDDAREQYLAAISADPSYSQAHNNLGNLDAASGRFAAAIEQYKDAISGDVAFAEAHYNLGTAYLQVGRPADAATAYREGLARSPENPRLATALAWLLATCPDDSVRDPGEAIRVAEALANRRDVDAVRTLDVLAAAYASAGRFEQAVEAVDRAINLAVDRHDASRTETLRARRSLYASGRPYLTDAYR